MQSSTKFTWLEMQVNSSGVMPIIFSTSLLAVPASVARFTGLAVLKNAAVALYPGGMFLFSHIPLSPGYSQTFLTSIHTMFTLMLSPAGELGHISSFSIRCCKNTQGQSLAVLNNSLSVSLCVSVCVCSRSAVSCFTEVVVLPLQVFCTFLLMSC